MHIAFLSNHDPEQISAWSGIPYFVYQGLKELGHQVDIYNTHIPMKEAVLRSMAAYAYEPEDSPWHYISPVTLKFTNQWVQQQLQQQPPDLILSQGAFWLAYLETRLPVVYWSDLPAYLLHSTYTERYQNAPPHLLQTWEQLEAMAFLSTDLVWYPSRWARDYVVQHQGVSEAQTVVLPFGANLLCPPTPQAVQEWIAKRRPGQEGEPLKLLFVGKEWERKGGPTLLALMEHFHAHQVAAHLHIVGCTPLIPEALHHSVSVHGFLDKNNPDHAALSERLWRENHFFAMPSRAEGFGIVYAEASAYGLPSLACDVGGVAAVVDDDNGKRFAPDTPVEEYAQWLMQYMARPERYQALCHTSRQKYEQQLNWQYSLSQLEVRLKNLLF